MVSVESILQEKDDLRNFPELCRLCGYLKDSVVSVYDRNENYEYRDLIEDVLDKVEPVEDPKTDLFPRKICIDCLTTVISWDEFRNKCWMANDKLREVVKKYNIDKPIESELDQPIHKVTVNDIEVIEVKVDDNYDFYNDLGDSSLLDEAMEHDFEELAAENDANDAQQNPNAAEKSKETKIIEENDHLIHLKDITACVVSDTSTIYTVKSRTPNDDKSCADEFLVDVSELSAASNLCEEIRIDDVALPIADDLLKNFVLNDQTPRFHCARCFKAYVTKHELLAHIRTEHTLDIRRSELYECDMCVQLFAKNIYRNRHRLNVHNIETPLDMNFKVVRADKNQLLEVDPTDESYHCKLCDQHFLRLGKFKFHNIRKHGAIYENARRCGICSMILLNDYSLRLHLQQVHSIGKKSANPISHEYLELLSKHVVFEDQKRYFQCDKCSYKCPLIKQFIRHGRRHFVSRPTCAHCGKSFNAKGLLLRHITVVHMRIKKYQCPTCGKLFGERRHMLEHSNLHNEDFSYICEVCGKGFKQRQSLIVHKQIHRGKKSFSCELCEKAFTFRSKLLNHMKEHTGKNLSICDLCGKKFTSSSYLKMHMRAHSDEKPFGCDVCSKQLKTSRSLKQHMIIFHSNVQTNGS